MLIVEDTAERFVELRLLMCKDCKQPFRFNDRFYVALLNRSGEDVIYWGTDPEHIMCFELTSHKQVQMNLSSMVQPYNITARTRINNDFD